MSYSALRVLVVEDNDADAEIILHELRKAGFDPDISRVQTEAQYREQLRPDLEIILCDFSLPQFDAMQALEILRAQGLDIPFLVVSGSIGEEVAVRAVQQGASDYLLKDRLGRLGMAVSQALAQKDLREAERRARAAEREAAKRLDLAVASTGMGVWEWDLQSKAVFWSAECYQIMGTHQFGGTLDAIKALLHPDDADFVMRAAATAIETRTVYSAEFRFIDSYGEVRWASNFGRCEYDTTGQPLRLVGTVQDITERKRNEVALKASQQRLAEAQRIAGIGSWAWEPPTGLVWWSTETFELFGFDPAATTPSYADFLRVVHPDDRERVDAGLQDILGGATATEYEVRIIRPDGQIRWINSRCQATRDATGQLLRIEGTDQDITERKHAAEVIAKSESRLRGTLESLIEGCQIIDFDFRYLYLNASAARQSRRKVEDLIGRRMSEAYPGIEKTASFAAIQSCMVDRVSRQLLSEFEFPDGSKGSFELSVQPIPEGVAILSVETTERRQAEQALRASEERYRILAESLPQLVWMSNPRGQLEYVNARCHEYSGLPLNDLPHWNWLEVVHPADHRAATERWVASLQSGNHYEVEFRLRRFDGEYRWHMVRGVPLRDEHGAIIKWFGTCTDNHDQKLADAALRASEERLRAVMTSVPDSILTISEACVIKSVNPATERLFGYSAAELIGQSVDLLLFGPVRAAQDLAQQFHDMAARTDGQPLEIYSHRRDGSGFPAELTVTDFLLEDAHYFTCVIREVSERKKLEAQFLQAQKMEAVGQLAGGIAHDFNNLLMVISGYCELILDDMPATDLNREAVMAISEAGNRAAALTRQLLAFSRKQILEPTLIDLNELVSRSETMIRRLIREDVIVTVNLSPLPYQLKADAIQVEQVLLNLVVNSRDAMPGGGRLMIETSCLEIAADRRFNDDDPAPGQYVRLSVSDTGCGMTEEVKSRIFEPFFTTKAVGKGTGLGLSVVHGIVKQSGGQIQVQSQPGKGTSFEILFPADIARTVPLAESDAGSVESRGSETILLVEDEPAVRQIARQILESQGYHVLEANHGAAALEVAARHEKPVDLLLTDIVMPEMGGRELASIMRDLQPGVRVLFMSGYTDDTAFLQGDNGISEILFHKPFSPKTLMRKVREILDHQFN